MRLTVPFREQLPPAIGSMMDLLIARINTVFAKEHYNDGTHSIITERGRTTPLGEWAAVPYAAANFTSPAGTTFVVTLAAQTTFKIMRVGTTLFVTIRLDGFTVTGAPTRLRIAIPESLRPTVTVDGLCIIQNNGGAFVTAAWEAAKDATTIQVFTSVAFAAWVAGAANNTILLQLAIETNL